jgi:hypothetical protein
VAALTAAWGGEVRWRRGPRVVSITDNYDNLGYPAAGVTRAGRPGWPGRAWPGTAAWRSAWAWTGC